jgi:hypothetical protein
VRPVFAVLVHTGKHTPHPYDITGRLLRRFCPFYLVKATC